MRETAIDGLGFRQPIWTKSFASALGAVRPGEPALAAGGGRTGHQEEDVGRGVSLAKRVISHLVWEEIDPARFRGVVEREFPETGATSAHSSHGPEGALELGERFGGGAVVSRIEIRQARGGVALVGNMPEFDAMGGLLGLEIERLFSREEGARFFERGSSLEVMRTLVEGGPRVRWRRVLPSTRLA